MRKLTTGLILTALLGLTACEPSGPAGDIGDNIDQVTANAAEDNSALNKATLENSTADNSATDNVIMDSPTTAPTTTETPVAANDEQTALEPEVLSAQKEQLEQANQVAAEEAADRLNEILEDTIDEP